MSYLNCRARRQATAVASGTVDSLMCENMEVRRGLQKDLNHIILAADEQNSNIASMHFQAPPFACTLLRMPDVIRFTDLESSG